MNKSRFPHGLKSLVDYGHSKNLSMGWYANNCNCREADFPPAYVDKHYAGDVAATVEAGFDGLKLDGCGMFMNLSRWEALLNASGRPVLIEVSFHCDRHSHYPRSSCVIL